MIKAITNTLTILLDTGHRLTDNHPLEITLIKYCPTVDEKYRHHKYSARALSCGLYCDTVDELIEWIKERATFGKVELSPLEESTLRQLIEGSEFVLWEENQK